MFRRSSLALVLCFAGCAAPVSEVGSTEEAIVNGTLGGNPAVVLVYNVRRGGLCTGSLIAERVVLTAKHCIQEAFAAGPGAPGDFIVGVGNSANQLTSTLRVQSIDTTPGQYQTDSRGGISGGGLVGVDVAVMILQSGAPGVEPLPIMRESHTTLGGSTITAVGFGQTPSGQTGVKYTTTGRVQGTDSSLIYVGAITCQGDSGGPAITGPGTVAGVVSFGAGSCGSGYGAYNAIYPFLPMIDAALAEAGSCLNDGAERCDGADNDCDDLVDEDCTPLGGACDSDLECVGLTCRETSAGRICTSPCDPLRPDFGCEPGSYCSRSEGCDGYCVPLGESEPSLGFGESCTSDEQCVSLYCADPGDGRPRCLSPCRGDEGMCLAGEACAANPGACGGCVDAAILRADRGIGEECTLPDECRSGECLEDAGRNYCTRDCAADADCPGGYHCRDDNCVVGPRGDIGDPCVTNGDCSEGTFCAVQGDRAWCTNVCGAEPCTEGFDCVPAGGTMVCAPALGLVGDSCMSNVDCVSNLCAIRGTSGECTRHCGADVQCSPGFECRRAVDGSAVCVRPAVSTDGGGCSVSRGHARSATGVAFALLALGVIGFRRRRR